VPGTFATCCPMVHSRVLYKAQDADAWWSFTGEVSCARPMIHPEIYCVVMNFCQIEADFNIVGSKIE
jgi:hypothetical protein